jgi:hypothetical protein
LRVVVEDPFLNYAQAAVMTAESSKLPETTETDESAQQAPLRPLVSPRWIVIGSLAMLVGLLMGFIMSSLGK